MARTLTLRYWVPVVVEFTAEQLLELDAHARNHWDLADGDKLASGELLHQAGRDGLIELEANYDIRDDDWDLPTDLTRAGLEAVIREEELS